jgi:hypothetical protein
MAAMLKTALAAISVLVVVAVGYLALSVAILHPPRVNYPASIAVAALVLALSGLTLAALSGLARRDDVRYGAIAGGIVLSTLGTWMIGETVSSAHFEGYALVLGAMLVAEGTLAIAVFSLKALRA